MDQLAAARRGTLGEIALLAQEHPEAAAGGVAGDARTVDATADDDEIEWLHRCARVQPFFFFFLPESPAFSLAGADLGRGP